VRLDQGPVELASSRVLVFMRVNKKDNLAKIPLISIVDDDVSIRNSTGRLVRSFGFRAEAFASALEFLGSGSVEDTACLILDVSMPEMGGLELQRQLAEVNRQIPIVFITATASEDEQRRAMKAGAVDFLRKPVGEQPLIKAIRVALRPGRQNENECRNPEPK
jgi:FixJ family two-component response regulator